MSADPRRLQASCTSLGGAPDGAPAAAMPEAEPPPALPAVAESCERAPAVELLAPTEPRHAPIQRRRAPIERRRAPARRRLRRVLAWTRTLALALALYVVLFNVSVVRGSSMHPGIEDGDRIVVDRLAYVLGSVDRGDVVVLKYPLDPTLDYVKRVIGLPGDEVVIDGGRVWVNGALLDEPYVAETDPQARSCVQVIPAHYFVLGDNRPRSSDSREFGQVPMDYVRGRVEVRLWPPSRIGAVQ